MRFSIGSFAAGGLCALGLLGLAIFGYFRFGLAPVATAAPPMLFEHALAKAALHARIRREMPTVVPIPGDEAALSAGARIYQKDCAVCHGLPDQPESAVARGMFPKPPQLFIKTVSHDPPGEIYWKTKNGIRLTGMPAFEGSLSEAELWRVSLLLKNADRIPPTVRALLVNNAADGSSGH